ncbi:formylmethanofuran dehydrogenase subunit B [Methanohalophilus levihalophilus]|uniref:formylmethanofuran dehydrogenase subunit B n=1 Tax=Methanohalophilus levihalophilus TaxID=1431282 RepID=UPI001AE4A220|nr:formylmethanofuran dehydrogenase subunit B [Methanohalophilus levihalophilus]
MEIKDFVCTGCALLCDDIGVKTNGNTIEETYNTCRKGAARIRGDKERLKCTIKGKEETIYNAIGEAAAILSGAKKPLIYGFGNSTLETQEKAIELAASLNAYLDDTSSFCQGPVVEAILEGKVPTCTLDDVRHQADVSLFWGCDPANSHPRHLSRFSYFPRGEKRQRGWEDDRTAIVIDVRKSDTAEICNKHFYSIPPGSDGELVEALTSALTGKIPKVSFNMSSKEILELANLLKKAEFGAIFVGLGLVYSLPQIEPILKLIEALNKSSNFHLIPMVGQYNMRGFDHLLFEKTGYINRVKFDGEKVDHGPHCSVMEVLNSDKADAALVIGSDPLGSFPKSIAEKLETIPTILIDPARNFTSTVADVTIPSAYSGTETGGTAIRMDGERIELTPFFDSEYLSDEEILTRILEAL